MTHENKITLAVLTSVAVLVPVVFGLALGWSPWVSMLLLVLMLTVPALVYRHFLERRRQDELKREWERQSRVVPKTEEPDERPFAAYHVDVELPSASPDFDFQFSVTVWWRVGSEPIGVRHHNPRALAADLVLGRAREIAGSEPPGRQSYLRTRLDSVLGCRLGDQSGQVEAYATDARVELADADAARLKRLGALREAEEDWTRQRDLERAQREYLGQEVMQDTGSALVWWLVQQAHSADDIRGAVGLIGDLSELSAAVNDTDVPERFRRYVRDGAGRSHGPASFEIGSAEGALLNGFNQGLYYYGAQETTFGLAAAPENLSATDLLGKMLDRLFEAESPERALTARRIAQFIDRAGHSETAEEIRRTFDAPAQTTLPTNDG
ncbi:hypothetical protein [Parasphingorhabdus pacifica]